MPIRQDTLQERWLTEQRFADTTRRTYRETLGDFQRRYPLHAERVRPAHLIDFLTTDADGHDTRRAPATLKRQRATLRVFWRWARRGGYIKADPAEDLDTLVLGSGDARQGRWLIRVEALRLLDACGDGTEKGQRDGTLILTGLLTGLRRAELAGLTWRQVDLSQGRLSLKGKGSKLATIGLPAQAVDALRRWRSTVHSDQGRAHGPMPQCFLAAALSAAFMVATPCTSCCGTTT